MSGSSSLALGTIIIIDIDKMEDIINERGWSSYKPNLATGELTRLAKQLITKWRAIEVYGLDEERGTEEIVIEIPYIDPETLKEDLVYLACEMLKTGVTVTIVAIWGPILGRRARIRREAYEGPRRHAKRTLEALKRRGGSRVYINGEIVLIRGETCGGTGTARDMEGSPLNSASNDDS